MADWMITRSNGVELDVFAADNTETDRIFTSTFRTHLFQKTHEYNSKKRSDNETSTHRDKSGKNGRPDHDQCPNMDVRLRHKQFDQRVLVKKYYGLNFIHRFSGKKQRERIER